MENSRLHIVVPLIGALDSLHMLLASVEHSRYDLRQVEVAMVGRDSEGAAAARLCRARDLTLQRRLVTGRTVGAALEHAIRSAAGDGYVLLVTAGQVLHPSAIAELTRDVDHEPGLVHPITNVQRGVVVHPPNGATFLDYRQPRRVNASVTPTCGMVPARVAQSLPLLSDHARLDDITSSIFQAWETQAGSRRTCNAAFSYQTASGNSTGPQIAPPAAPTLASFSETTDSLRGRHEFAVYATSFARRVLHAAENRLGVDRPPIGRHAYKPRDANATTSGRPQSAYRPGDRPSVLYLLPALGRWGGVISVLQLVNRMVIRGIDANIATHSLVEPRMLREPMLFRPHLFHTRTQLIKRIRHYDVVVAASWDTVFDALEIQKRTGCRVVHFIQDYDPAVQVPGSRRHKAAEQSLSLIEHKIVKSAWLADRVLPFGGHVHHVPLGLNLDTFYPPVARPPGRPHVLVHARPRAAVRNLDGAVEILSRLQERRPDVVATFVGRRFAAPTGLEHQQLGELPQAGVADALRKSSVLLDASLFQGFGRPGLEAMACGVPAVVTSKGGINEYAVSGKNCLQADPEDIDGFVSGIERILDDQPFRESLRRAGLETADRYDAEAEADRTIALFTDLAAQDHPSG